MRKMEIVRKIREYSKYLAREAVKNQIQKEFGVSNKVYDNILAKFINGPKVETAIAEVDCQNILDIDHLICVLAQLHRENKGKFDKVIVKGKINIGGETRK